MRRVHQGSVDSEGNYRDISRKKEGYLESEHRNLPFPGLVTAWYPKSQTIDVIRPVDNGSIEYKGVVVYGNFFDATGTIQGPKIATTLKDDGYTTYRDDEQRDPTSGKYVLDNHIEAIVCPMIVGSTIGYSASNFRFINTDSPLLNNVKTGRKIVRHDDGSYYIHDEDGNMQFVHPSGLKVKIGDSLNDIDLEVPFPDHAKNVQDYNDEVLIKVEHPSGSIVDYDNTGLFGITSSTGENLKIIIDSFITEVSKIVVANGTGPDTAALSQLQTDLSNLLK